jgi:hypothetical protein
LRKTKAQISELISDQHSAEQNEETAPQPLRRLIRADDVGDSNQAKDYRPVPKDDVGVQDIELSQQQDHTDRDNGQSCDKRPASILLASHCCLDSCICVEFRKYLRYNTSPMTTTTPAPTASTGHHRNRL